MITRRALVATACAAALAPLAAFAQRTNLIPIVGVLGAGAAERVNALRDGLRVLGYEEGPNLRLLVRAAGDRYGPLPDHVAEFVRLKADVIVAIGSTSTVAAAKSGLPVVMVAGFDPVKAKLAASLARPGGNVTGIALFLEELTGKRVQIAKEAVPGLHRIGVLWNPDSRASTTALAETKGAAKKLQLELHAVEARQPSEFDAAFDALVKARVKTVLVSGASMFQANRQALLASALAHRIAAICDVPAWGDAGALISYGVPESQSGGRAAAYVDKILKGVKPGEIPIEQPTWFEFVLNQKTAKALGLKMPGTILLQATRVIE